MRMLKGFGMALLVAVLVVGLAVVAFGKASAAESSATINASFTIPSWISLTVVGSGDVAFSDIVGPGTYKASNGTELRVLSTTSWALTSAIVWSESDIPSGAGQATIEKALNLTLSQTSGSWGVHTVDASYEFELSENDLANLPVGDYNLVIQYTATTD
jgi:hypothetical protein